MRLQPTGLVLVCLGLGGVLLTGGCGGPGGGGGGGGNAGGFVDPADAVTATDPTNGATEVAVDTVITISFARAANPGSLDAWLTPDVGVELTWSDGNTLLTAAPTAPLDLETEYTVSVGELTFVDGAELADEFSFRFTTASQTNGDNNGSGAQPLPIDEIEFWGYQIQAMDAEGSTDALAASRYDMLVLEPARTDAEMLDFDTKAMVDRLKSTKAHDGVHRKLIIAYVDIGEAEDWRWYWTWSKEEEGDQIPEETNLPEDFPDFIVARDPDGWAGNYPVAYWEDEWTDIVIYGENHDTTADRNFTSIIDEVILDGFDGIYLDWVEGFENVHVIAAAEAEDLDPAEEMVDFIAQMRAYARQRDPDFLIIQQNAAALIDGHPDLLNHIDAIAQEGVWYDGGATDDWTELEGYWETDQQLVGEYVGFLDEYLEDIPVFVCEYALQDNSDDAYARAYAKGYVPYVTRRSLGQLTGTPPPTY
ncbi:MAG: hypothetical protein GY842_17025 [bacterium]|nr:hypothetical protein [bacterium]